MFRAVLRADGRTVLWLYKKIRSTCLIQICIKKEISVRAGLQPHFRHSGRYFSLQGFQTLFLFLFCFPVPFSGLLLPVQSLFDNAPHNIFRHLPGNIAVYISIPVDHKCGRKG